MHRSFSADISIKISKASKNVVSIIPFCDSDKHIAIVLEKVLNKYLDHDGDFEYMREDSFKKITKEFR